MTTANNESPTISASDRDLVTIDAARSADDKLVQDQRRLLLGVGRQRRQRRQWLQAIRPATDEHSPRSSGSCPACPLPLLAVTAMRQRNRESHDFTLKRNRAERVQIVNGIANAPMRKPR